MRRARAAVVRAMASSSLLCLTATAAACTLDDGAHEVPAIDVEADEAVVARSDGELVLPVPLDPEVDERRAALGERLFFDPILSGDRTVSCASCHDLARGGADGLPHSALPNRTPGPVNVPTVLNVGLNFRWSWTGRWELMAEQIDVAILAQHAMASTLEAGTEAARPTYERDFAAVYRDGLTPTNLRDALTEYLRSLTTPNAPFDRFLRGDEEALDPEARRGWDLFRSYGCVTCHQGVNVGGNLFQRFGVMEDYLDTRPEQTPADQGRYAVTRRESDRHVFRVPGLRNVALTAPYFHDGSAPTLGDAIQVMARYQLGRQLTEDQVRAIQAFLESLTGDQPRPRARG